MRTQENQYLVIPKDVVKGYSEEVQAIIGYSVSQPYCGYVEMDDPIKLLKDNANFAHHDLQGDIFEGPGSENFKGERPTLPVASV